MTTNQLKELPERTSLKNPATSLYVGEVVYLYAFDLAHELERQPLRELLGQPVAQFSIDVTKRSPRQLFFHRPQMVRLPPVERIGPRGTVRVQRTVKLLPIGAMSISVRVPYAVEQIQDLVAYHDLQFTNGSLNDEVRELAEQIRHEMASHCVRPVPELADEEAYTVFCIESASVKANAGHPSAESWLRAHRREVASLLTQEPDTAQLSDQETIETTRRRLSYYHDDLVVIDWDAAVLVDQAQDFDETLHVMELANLQLAELEAYDRILDGALERSYRDLRTTPTRKQADILAELRELRIDLARFNDELSNITKFFGDWHLARIYELLSARFHLADWHRTLDEKLKTLDNLYELLKHEQLNRWMLILEVTIVLLFIIDVAMLLVGFGGR